MRQPPAKPRSRSTRSIQRAAGVARDRAASATARRSIHRVGPRHNRYAGLITSSVNSTAMSMSPATATAGGDHPKQRQVGAHAAEVDGEERGDERQRPATIDGRARRSAASTSAAIAAAPGWSGQPELVEDGLVGFGGRVHRRDDDVPRDAEDPERAGQSRRPSVESQPGASSISSTTARLPSAASAVTDRCVRSSPRRRSIA